MDSPARATKPSRRRMRAAVALAVFVLLAAASVVVFRGAGRWLVRPDPPAPADVIVVLSGAMPSRAEEAAHIFQQGDSHKVWITRPESPADELASFGVAYTGEEEYSRQVLLREGVPAQAIRILPRTIVNTQQEIAEISREARVEGDRTVLIVTSPQHTRRVKALWRKLVGRDPALIVCAAPEDGFDADHWWRDTHDAFAVVRELLGLLNVWFGLPVRPASAG